MRFTSHKKIPIFTAFAIGCISISAFAKSSSATNTFDYTFMINTMQYSGTYSGETINGRPSGKGEFQSDADSPSIFSYSGEFENGLFEGNGIYTYSDGSYLECEFASGVPTGKGTVTYPDNSYSEIKYDDFGIPYGATNKYSENDKFLSRDFYNNGELVSTLMQQAQQIDYSELYRHANKYFGSILKIKGTVIHVYEDDTSCTFKFQDAANNLYWGNYKNTSYNKYNQAIMPTLQEGDQLTLYAFAKGVSCYTVPDDAESLNILLPEVSAITATLDNEPFDYNTLSRDYEYILRFPFHYYKIENTLEGHIQSIIKSRKTYIKITDDKNHIYYISPKSSKEAKSLMPGDFISVDGYYQGLYKEFDTESKQNAQPFVLFKGSSKIIIIEKNNE